MNNMNTIELNLDDDTVLPTYKVIDPANQIHVIRMCLEDIWIMELTTDGVKFNRDSPHWKEPDEVAKKIIEILEGAFPIKFEKKSSNCLDTLR